MKTGSHTVEKDGKKSGQTNRRNEKTEENEGRKEGRKEGRTLLTPRKEEEPNVYHPHISKVSKGDRLSMT